jgi:hypothetical protein
MQKWKCEIQYPLDGDHDLVALSLINSPFIQRSAARC